MKSPVTIRFSPLLLLAALLFALASPSAYAAATFQAAGTAVGGTGAVSPAWPAHAVDDIALLFVESTGGGVVTLSTPAGFAAVTNSPQSTGAGTAGTRISVFWARATSTAMGAPTVADPGDHVYAQIITYRGVVNTSNPWDVTIGGTKAAASTSVSVTGVTTTVANTLIVQVASQDIDATGAAFSAQANATLTGIAERSDAGTNSGNGGGFAVWDGTKATAGATGNTTATVTSSLNAFMTIALKPQLPAVSSINRASVNPSYAGDAVSWTVVFNMSVTGVDATDFALVEAGGAAGSSITSVTGAGTTWTVTANSGTSAGTLGLNLVDDDTIVNAGIPLGGSGAGNGDFTGQVYTLSAPFCSPPSNVPAGVTVSCVCDRFGRASLNPSTIYGSNWIVSTSDTTGIVPYINGTSGLLRLTENTGNNAKAATVPGIFPAAGNYISVEFQHYAYGGSGADGIAVTLSDYSVTAVPGAFGGSLGYAQKTPPAVAANVPGFAGGWIGVGIDEFGNYQNPTEGRIGGPGARVDSVGVRGSGTGVTGYNWIAGTATLAPGVDNTGSATPAPGAYYQVIVDARNASNATPQTFVSVNRDTTSGSGTAYTSLITPFDVFTANPSQAAVPTNWQISFTGSTGGSTNIHEIGGLRICAQSVAPPSGGTASGFNAIDEAYGTPPSGPAVQSFLNGHIYMKVAGTAFKLNVAALNNNQILTTYAASSTKNVTVKLVDNSDSACVLDSTQANYCNSTCTAKAAVAGGSQTLAFVAGDAGKKQSANFTINSAYKNLAAIISDGTTTACSTDAFSVRPASIASVTQTGSAGPFKAASDNFSLAATITGIATYTGIPKINSAAALVVAPATTTGTVAGTFSAATAVGGDSVATGSAFTYTEVGAFLLRAPDFTVPRIPGVYDDTWTAIDSDPTKNDCNSGTSAAAYTNTKDANGKYGCNFGITSNTAAGGFGRFTPAYFDVTRTHGCTGASFTYAGVIVGLGSTPVGQPFSVTATARNGAGNVTQNYHSAYGLAKDTTISNAGTATGFFNNVLTAATGTNGFTNGVATTNTIYYSFAAKETAPATLTLRAVDTDLISSSGHTEETTEARSGRIQIQNASGSELVDLAVPMRVQYYTTNGWVTNTTDSCTTVTMSFPAFYSNLASTETCIQDASPPRSGAAPTVSCAAVGPVPEQFLEAGFGGFNGDFNLYLKAPGAGNDGGVDISADLATLPALPWLRYDWDGNGTHDNNPTGRATFGVYRGSPRHIYIRERY